MNLTMYFENCTTYLITKFYHSKEHSKPPVNILHTIIHLKICERRIFNSVLTLVLDIKALPRNLPPTFTSNSALWQYL